ncbi:MAG: glycoside hydrolase family 3 C-terminal domain-containing protein [Lachnospiraceae bacterium]|nr:glycoside hydrolase family 3 C-terminal domain-containing protein [Lachnospiraceae bacterium]
MRNRASELLSQMTLDEKIGMIHGNGIFATRGVKRLNIPPLVMSDGPMGVRADFYPDRLDRIDDNTDFATYLPCGSALASTWNRDLAYMLGQTLGREARGRGKDVILAPAVNIKRSPLCGRNHEYFSEDPYLTAELACEEISAIQESDVAACVKHFAANNQESNRFEVDTVVDGESLERIYFPAFKAAVGCAGVYTIMGAYNKLNGEYCCHNDELLRQKLREEWGFEGVVISDWGATHNTYKAAGSELDIEMDISSDFDDYYMAEPLKKKIESGEIAEAEIDKKVYHILLLMLRLNMLDGAERNRGDFGSAENRLSCLNIARESIILLKNENILPLSKDKAKKVLVIGENADRKHSEGGESAEIKALYEYTPLAGIRMLLGGNSRVDHLLGYSSKGDIKLEELRLPKAVKKTIKSGNSKSPQSMSLKEKRRLLREEVLANLKDYDQVIFVGGLNRKGGYDCEGSDRKNMELPYEQSKLLEELLEKRPDTVVVMMAGSSVSMEKFADKTRALIWSYYAGMEGGRALAEVIYGDVNPSGKLAETLYKKLEQCSAHSLGDFGEGERVEYREGLLVGYRYTEKKGIMPGYPFGFGLSYTDFEYRNPFVDLNEGYISCDIHNTGDRNGKETVQLYVMNDQNKENEPVKELVGFEKVFLIAGEEKEVKIYPREIIKGRKYLFASSSRDIELILEIESDSGECNENNSEFMG